LAVELALASQITCAAQLGCIKTLKEFSSIGTAENVIVAVAGTALWGTTKFFVILQ
jgi:hypothetical protein